MDSLISKCTNMFGTLNADCQARLRAVLLNPTQETWENAYSLIISTKHPSTLWQAWIEVDPSAPRRKSLEGPWPRIPDQMTIARAIAAATRNNKQEVA